MGSTHEVILRIRLRLEEMDGSPEESAEIAMELAEEAIDSHTAFYVEDVETVDYRAVAPTRSNHVARFHPQAWIDGHAVEVDAPEGAEWVVGAAFLLTTLNAWCFDASLGNRRVDDSDLYKASDLSDRIREDPAAPAWAQHWDGPFWVEVKRLER